MKYLSATVTSTAYKVTKTVTGVGCDICKKVIPIDEPKRDNKKYFRVTTGHNDWGNDSCDSIEYRDICPDCVGKFVTNYLSKADGTSYLKVETKYARAEKQSTVVDKPPEEGKVFRERNDFYDFDD